MGDTATTEIETPALASVAFVDLAFAVRGPSLPVDHRQALRDAVISALTWFGDEPKVAIHPLKSARGDDGVLLLSSRARLVLRVPVERRDDTVKLCGRVLEVDDARITLGPSTARALLGHGTVYAHLVSGDIDDEIGFTTFVRDQLATYAIRGDVICGRRQTIGTGARMLRGFSVMVHGLSPDASLQLQTHGLGDDMKLGCGIFVPHRSAATALSQ